MASNKKTYVYHRDTEDSEKSNVQKTLCSLCLCGEKYYTCKFLVFYDMKPGNRVLICFRPQGCEGHAFHLCAFAPLRETCFSRFRQLSPFFQKSLPSLEKWLQCLHLRLHMLVISRSTDLGVFMSFITTGPFSLEYLACSP